MPTFALTTNGVRREFDGKWFGEEFRVYTIRGDVSNTDEVKEALQELATMLGLAGAERVTYGGTAAARAKAAIASGLKKKGD